MVMSAGQRTSAYIARNDGFIDSSDGDDADYETTSDDYQHYSFLASDDAEQQIPTKSHTRIRARNKASTKRHKSKAHVAQQRQLSTIRPKLQNMLLLSRSSSPAAEAAS
jgi:hypothetical protein